MPRTPAFGVAVVAGCIRVGAAGLREREGVYLLKDTGGEVRADLVGLGRKIEDKRNERTHERGGPRSEFCFLASELIYEMDNDRRAGSGRRVEEITRCHRGRGEATAGIREVELQFLGNRVERDTKHELTGVVRKATPTKNRAVANAIRGEKAVP